MTATAEELLPATRNALSLLLLAMADDEFVIGFSDSEWTGIAPLLEEDVAMSSLAQDELGHAQALYRLLAELVEKIRREERYHLLHIGAWFERLAAAPGEPRRRLLEALERMGPDAATVLTPLPDELSLVLAGIVDAPSDELEARWRERIRPVFDRLDLPMPPSVADPGSSRTRHSDAFRWLHGEFTAVRRIDREATW